MTNDDAKKEVRPRGKYPQPSEPEDVRDDETGSGWKFNDDNHGLGGKRPRRRSLKHPGPVIKNPFYK